MPPPQPEDPDPSPPPPRRLVRPKPRRLPVLAAGLALAGLALAAAGPAAAAAGRLDGFAGITFGTARAVIEQRLGGTLLRSEPNRLAFFHSFAGTTRTVFVYLPAGHAVQFLLQFGAGRDEAAGNTLFAQALEQLTQAYGPPDEMPAEPAAAAPPSRHPDLRTAYWTFEQGGEIALTLRRGAGYVVSAAFDPDFFNDFPLSQ